LLERPLARHEVLGALPVLLSPLFRYSMSHDAWVLRGVGTWFGPVFRRRFPRHHTRAHQAPLTDPAILRRHGERSARRRSTRPERRSAVRFGVRGGVAPPMLAARPKRRAAPQGCIPRRQPLGGNGYPPRVPLTGDTGPQSRMRSAPCSFQAGIRCRLSKQRSPAIEQDNPNIRPRWRLVRTQSGQRRRPTW
jgi:hypothetical protein